jgi:ABC-type transport system involved in multi-copper enzyme maturation permease subunit
MRYEFRMQLRRKALWITFLVFSLSLFTLTFRPWSPQSEGLAVPHLVANWSLVVQFLHPVAFGILLADRLPREGRTKVQELLDTLPASLRSRFLGKYLGATLATLVPLVLIYAAGVAYVAVSRDDPMALPLGVAAFATINLPGLLFVAAFSISCTAVLWVPLYQFLFVGYWFWGNLIPVGFDMPTLSRTILTPFGEYMANGFFGTEQATARATVLEGMASMSLLLVLGALTLYGGYRVLIWRQRAAEARR